MTKLKLKKGDTVLVISGKDKGRKGAIKRVIPTENRIVVEGINVRKRHVRPRRSGEKGQIIASEAPFSLSNVKLVCPKCQKATRLGWRMTGSKKARFCKKCESDI